MKGFRTVIINVLIVMITAGLQHLAGINWIELVGPTLAAVIVAAVNIALRAVTTTAIGKAQ